MKKHLVLSAGLLYALLSVGVLSAATTNQRGSVSAQSDFKTQLDDQKKLLRHQEFDFRSDAYKQALARKNKSCG